MKTASLIAAIACALVACGPDDSAVPAPAAQSATELLLISPSVPPRGEPLEILGPIVVVEQPDQALIDARLNVPTPEESFFFDVALDVQPCPVPGPGAPPPHR